jgi:hypothetical protein
VKTPILKNQGTKWFFCPNIIFQQCLSLGRIRLFLVEPMSCLHDYKQLGGYSSEKATGRGKRCKVRPFQLLIRPQGLGVDPLNGSFLVLL